MKRLNSAFAARFWLVAILALTMLSFASAQACERYGGNLIVAMTYEPAFLNINYNFDGGAPYYNMNVYSKLVNYNAYDWTVHGDLAEAWEVSDDGLVYTFHLRRGVLWHDGAPFTSADVVWTIQSILDEGTAAATFRFVQDVASVAAPDDHAVVIELNEPNTTFVEGLASYYSFNILPKHLYEGTDVRNNPLNFAPIGTGPFRYVENVPGSHTVFEANRDYFGAGPCLDQLIFRVIPNRATIMAALERGEVGYSAASPPFSEGPRLGQQPGISVDPSAFPIIHWFGFNFEREELANPLVRRAIIQAIDKDEINSRVFLDYVKPAYGNYTSLFGDWYNAEARQPAYDPEAARALLDEAGYPVGPNGIRFTLTYVSFTASIFGGQEISEMVRSFLAEVGIEVKLENLDFALFNERIRNQRQFDLVHSGGIWGPPPSELSNFVHSNGVRNVMPYHNERVDSLLENAFRTVDTEASRQAFFEVQEILAEDLPLVTVVEYYYLRPYRSEFHDFWWQEASVGKAGIDMYNLVWWDQGRAEP